MPPRLAQQQLAGVVLRYAGRQRGSASNQACLLACHPRRAWLSACRCPECKHGDIDFSDPSFLQLTGLRPDRVKIEWSFTPCAPYIKGSIRVRAAWRLHTSGLASAWRHDAAAAPHPAGAN